MEKEVYYVVYQVMVGCPALQHDIGPFYSRDAAELAAGRVAGRTDVGDIKIEVRQED